MQLSQTPYAAGSWTPALAFATAGDSSIIFSQQVGSYIRIGNKVKLNWRLLTSTFTHTTASGTLSMSGLPFTARTLANMQWVGSMFWQGITKANYTQMVPTLASAGTTITFIACGSAQGASALAAADTPTGGTLVLTGTLEYECA